MGKLYASGSRRATSSSRQALIAFLAAGVFLLFTSEDYHRVQHVTFVPGLAADARETQRTTAALDSDQVAIVDRRRAMLLGGGSVFYMEAMSPSAAGAAVVKSVVVAGATGQTGRRILERLGKVEGISVTGGVRDVKEAQKKLGEAKVEIRGLMMDRIDAVVDTKGIALKRLDVVKDNVDTMASTMKGADALVIATGFVPGNPFELGKEAHAVDNLGTVALIDAAKKAGLSKVVLVTSILTNARAWGQQNSPGFLATNVFGGVLDEKLVAEKHLRASGLDYTIVRPGGLKSTPPSGNLVVNREDTTNGAEISRDLVADVCIASLFDGKASNKVIEIIEGEDTPNLPKSEWFAKLA